MVYETANYAVSHIYKFNERELRAIETRSPVGVLESSLGMALTVSQPYPFMIFDYHALPCFSFLPSLFFSKAVASPFL